MVYYITKVHIGFLPWSWLGFGRWSKWRLRARLLLRRLRTPVGGSSCLLAGPFGGIRQILPRPLFGGVQLRPIPLFGDGHWLQLWHGGPPGLRMRGEAVLDGVHDAGTTHIQGGTERNVQGRFLVLLLLANFRMQQLGFLSTRNSEPLN